jgi:hypothetical protein
MGGQMLFFSKNPRLASIPLLLPFYLLLYTLKSRKLFIPMAIRKIVFFIGTFFLILFSFLTCEKNISPVENKTPQISLRIDEVAVTETWLNLQTENLLDKDILQIFRNDSAIYTRKPGPADTTIYDSGLLPAHDYIYHALLTRNNQVILKSNPQSITTMDTTSHEFIWTIDTIGIYGSVLYDIAMVDENDIWAVGEIHTPETDKYDSLGNWVPPFNAVHWNGYDWDLVRSEAEGYGFGANYAVLVFKFDDVWLGSTIPEHWDGQQWKFYSSINGYPGEFNIRKIWGNSSHDLYFVGNSGNIVYHNGAFGYWSQIESDTDMPIQDIWGATDPGSGRDLILAVTSPKYNWQKPLLLNLSKHPVKSEFLTVYNLLHSVWFETPRKIFLCGDGVHYRVNETWNRVEDLPSIFYNRIRGSGLNNIWVVGDFGIVLHYNGVTWKEIPQLWLSTGNYEGLAVKDNLTVAVGWKGESAIVIRGIPLK